MIHNSKTITTTFFSTLDKDQTIDCLKFLLLPWKWRKWKEGKYIQQAEVEMKNYLNENYFNETQQPLAGDCGGERVAKKVFSFYNGRTALYYALKFAGVGEGDEVIIQAYTCVSVPNAVLETGAQPIYCDIDESLNLDPLELVKKITDKTKVVIVQHTFGNPARIDEIKKACGKGCNEQENYVHGKIPPNPPFGKLRADSLGKGGMTRNIILIEDCAHSLGAKYNGKLAGTFGDMSIFSFGRDKVISSVNGGMLCVNNSRIKGDCHLSSPPYFLIARNLMYPIIAQISLKWYNKGKIGKSIMYAAKKLKLFPLILSKEEKQGRRECEEYRMPNVLAYLFLHQFEKLDEYNAHRRKIAEYYNEALRRTELNTPKVWDGSESVYLRYTVLTDRAAEIMEEARKKNIYLGDWYRNVIAPVGVNLAGIGYEQNSCSKAEKYSAMTLNLPNHSGIDLYDAKRVAGEIKNSPNSH